ncbi:MAG: hypothetical protein PHD55_09615 [Methanoregula sp.]|nr:hypothetical protein [Methanoregula sp.]
MVVASTHPNVNIMATSVDSMVPAAYMTATASRVVFVMVAAV